MEQIHPRAANERTLGAFSEGWLTFDSAVERRRLAPYSPAWMSLSDAELAEMCRNATPASRRLRFEGDQMP